MHNPPAVSNAKSFGLASAAFLIVAFLIGVAGALQAPTLNIFLTDEVYARPAMVGFLFTSSTVVGVLVSQFLTGHSGKRGDHRSLIVFCCLLGVLACTLFTWDRNYFILLSVGVFPSSLGSTANSQMFVLAYEHADKAGYEAVMFSSFLRAQVSLTWVIDPPLVYALAMDFSFTIMYLGAAATFIACGVMVWLLLSSMQEELPLTTSTVEAPCRNRRDTLLLLVICTLMWSSNSLYIINIPLFIINKLHLPEKLTGVMVGTATGLEVPVMLITGYFAERLGKRFLMRVAAMGGVCFYAGILIVHSPVVLLGLQLLNAIFIGILGGIGMLYFRDLIPGRAGSVTTLYTNASRVGWIIAGLVAGIVVEVWNYHAVFWFAMVMIIATLFCLLRIKDV